MSDIPQSVSLAALPAVKQPLADGLFGGVITLADGRHVAVVWLDKATPPQRQHADAQRAWAAEQGAQLITRAMGPLLVSTLGDLLPQTWVWTSEDCDFDPAYAWNCTLGLGYVIYYDRSAKGGAVAVRLIPLIS